MKVEDWCGYKIRFVEENGEWWAVLSDICKALGVSKYDTEAKLDSDMMIRVEVFDDDGETCWTVAVNESGIYEVLFASDALEARQFRRWGASVMSKLRSWVGLEGYEIMRMTESEIQEDINNILDTLYWDEETGRVMMSVTVQGGDVDQIPFEEIE